MTLFFVGILILFEKNSQFTLEKYSGRSCLNNIYPCINARLKTLTKIFFIQPLHHLLNLSSQRLSNSSSKFNILITTVPYIYNVHTLREKSSNTEFFLVRIQENTDQKKLRIWTLFTQ